MIIKEPLNTNEKSLNNYINKDINLSKLTVLTGLNGCGKTHLLNYLNRSIQKDKKVKINYIPYNWEAKNIWKPKNNGEAQNEMLSYFNRIEAGYDSKLIRINEEIGLYKQLVSQGKKESDALLQCQLLSQIKNSDTNYFEDIIKKGHVDEYPIEKMTNLKEWDDFIKFIVETNRQREKKAWNVVGDNPLEAQKIRKQKTQIDIINDLFEMYEFKYRIQERSDNFMQVVFVNKECDEKQTISLANLSSGEKMIVSLIMWSHVKCAMVKYLLLDEPDAHLHPSLSKMLVEIIYNKFVKEYDMKVIMATHCPSTIAYLPENDDTEILFMNKEKKSIEVVQKDIAITQLSSGLMLIDKEYIELVLDDALGEIEEKKPFLLVEGETDKIIIKTAWKKLYPERNMPFYIQPMFDCNQIVNTFKRQNIFSNHPKRLCIGLLDYDDALKTWKEKSEKQYSYEKEKQIYRNKNKDYYGYVFALPVPETRKQEAGEDMRDSYLTIEKYFKDDKIKSFCKTQRVVGGAEILIFDKDKKSKFAKSTKNFPQEEFENFKLLFNKIEGILNEHEQELVQQKNI